jgi:hypothetical protein
LEPPWTQARGVTITVSVENGCPSSIGDANNVDFSKLSQPGHLVPADRAPDAGLVCEYRSASGSSGPALQHQVVLTAVDAQHLAAAAAAVAIKSPPTGPISCPAEFGSFAVIAFGYPSGGKPSAGNVDLWYHSSGCEWMGNGDVVTSPFDNPSFGDFQSVLVSMAPARWGQ